MFKEFIARKLMERQLRSLPPAQRDAFMHAYQANPTLFATIASEIEAKKKSGKSDLVAAMEVMKSHQKELQEAFAKSGLTR